jgi:hypothetical protein
MAPVLSSSSHTATSITTVRFVLTQTRDVFMFSLATSLSLELSLSLPALGPRWAGHCMAMEAAPVEQ